MTKQQDDLVLPEACSTKDMITFPNALNERLMEEASFNCSPVVCVDFCRSLPARSIKLKRENFLMVMPSLISSASMMTVKTECDLLDSLFIAVSPTRRFRVPNFILVKQ